MRNGGIFRSARNIPPSGERPLKGNRILVPKPYHNIVVKLAHQGHIGRYTEDESPSAQEVVLCWHGQTSLKGNHKFLTISGDWKT